MLLASVSTRPKKEYGQHFLRDPNILEVIGRLAELAPGDVVLEIGPGQGVLTRYLAERVRHVHAVEVDRALEPDLTGLADNVDVVFGDALRIELPHDATKLVANLPYNVATPLIVESLDGLPNVRLWCVMVQREVADRLFASPGTKDYGAVSVLVQLAAERTGFHPVSRWVFQPPPNVDSALVAFRRKELPPNFAEVKKLVSAAFAHRRKTIGNSIELAELIERETVRAYLAEMDCNPDVRAEMLRPEQFVELAEWIWGNELPRQPR
jgi:16S rRNA (adenine1518-N6/adenine1519-N6)-dimethyltransferase